MPALPWVSGEPIVPDREYAAMASRLPLRSHRWVPAFLRDTRRIRRQLARTPGLVGYMLDAKIRRKTFFTFSVWTDQEALGSFARAYPHATITRSTQPRMADTRFEFFSVFGSELPLSWEQVRERLG